MNDVDYLVLVTTLHITVWEESEHKANSWLLDWMCWIQVDPERLARTSSETARLAAAPGQQW